MWLIGFQILLLIMSYGLVTSILWDFLLVEALSLQSFQTVVCSSRRQYVTVYARIVHMLGKIFFELLMHKGRFTPLSWKVLSFLVAKF